MISLIKVKVVGGRKNADFCEYRNKNGSYRRNYFICKKHDIHCVILFGSRARGDFKRTSDIDIAASGGDFDRFALDVDEEKSTLLEFDIVDLERDMQDALRENMKDIYNYEEPYDNVVLTGLVGLYEITFEQSWKMMKEILEIHGFAEGATSSPKMILRTAYKAGMIKDEELWLSALQERNNVTHSYNRKIAMGIITQAKQKFYKMFCELKEEIDRNWI